MILQDVLLAGSVAGINGFNNNEAKIPLPKNLTFTETINIQLLYKKIDVHLSRFEIEMNSQEDKFSTIEEDINLLPKESDERQECIYRLHSLKNAASASKCIERIERQLNSDDHPLNVLETHDLYNDAKRLLSNSLYTPFTQLLKNRLANVECQVFFQEENSEDNTLTILDKIKLAKTVIDLDEVLLEFLPDDYINLGQRGRLKVAEMLLAEKISYSVIQDVIDAFFKFSLDYQVRLKLVHDARTHEELILALHELDIEFLSKYSKEEQRIIADFILEKHIGKLLTEADIIKAVTDGYNDRISRNEKKNEENESLLISIETIKDLEGKINIK